MQPADREHIGALARLTCAPSSELSAILETPWRYYRSARLPKKDGTFRRIRAPLEPLKRIQVAILSRSLSALDIHPANHCRRGRSVITNAKAHLQQDYVAAYDLHAAFPSTRPGFVRTALLAMGIDPVLAEGITCLCTIKRELPQGAPTSPALLSLVLRPLDDSLTLEAQRQGMIYTRYMDDLFVSGGRRMGMFDRFLRLEVAALGYRLAAGKARRWGPGRPATLAGVVLNTTMSPTPEFTRSVVTLVRQIESGELAPHPGLRATLEGKIAWIRALDPRAGELLRARLNAALSR